MRVIVFFATVLVSALMAPSFASAQYMSAYGCQSVNHDTTRYSVHTDGTIGNPSTSSQIDVMCPGSSSPSSGSRCIFVRVNDRSTSATNGAFGCRVVQRTLTTTTLGSGIQNASGHVGTGNDEFTLSSSGSSINLANGPWGFFCTIPIAVGALQSQRSQISGYGEYSGNCI